jgi:tRNA A37 N6-isopentenylltransferase MiaA
LRQAIGVRPIYAMLQGYLSQEECRHQYLMEIAQYIKQQRTWFRGQFSADYVWDSENAMME